MPYASAYEVLHTCSTSKEIACTGSTILDRVALRKSGNKNSFSPIVID